jgi:signal transduction histidine kinase
MAQKIQRIPREDDAGRREADRARLLERVAAGLAHEGKNPLHNMVLHVQLMAEGAQMEKHLSALRDGIGRVDALLKSFGEFAQPGHLPPDMVAAVNRALQLFAYDARRASVQISLKGPTALLVSCDSRLLNDMVAHALVAALELSRDGGTIEFKVHTPPARSVLEVRADGALARREEAEPHLDALRRLAAEAGCELSIETPPAGGARFSLSFVQPR